MPLALFLGKLSIQELLERYNLQQEESSPTNVSEEQVDRETLSDDDGNILLCRKCLYLVLVNIRWSDCYV